MNKQSSITYNRILLTYTGFVIACVVVIVAFITAKTYTQLTTAIILYPLLAFFAYKVFPISPKCLTKTTNIPLKPSAETAEKAESLNIGKKVEIADIDKRLFLKLVGGAGIFLFLFSLFNKRGEGMFFKNLAKPGSVSFDDLTGNKAAAPTLPFDGYNISEIDDNEVSFYGYTHASGSWYVLKIDTITGSFRYAKGNSDFPNNWANREKLSYDYYNNIF